MNHLERLELPSVLELQSNFGIIEKLRTIAYHTP